MDRAKKKLVSAIDGIRNLHLRTELDVEEKITPDCCSLTEIVRHGFPDDPRCLAVDPVQKLVAIGAGHGCARLLGDVDFYLKHDSEEPVIFVQFLVNEGGLITALRDDSVHLWNFRQKRPEIVHSLKLAKEKITCVMLPFQSKWLHVGTDKGNVYFVGLADFELSTYVINWNKAIDLSCRTHPGAVRALTVCPTESSKLLMLYERGQVVLWSLLTRESERFCVELAPVKCFAWNNDGKQFMCGHKDGSLTMWNVKKPRECVQKTTPHAAAESVQCRPVTQLHWAVNAEGEQMILFAGGMPMDEGALPALTILRSKGSITVLEMDYPIIDVQPLNSSPYNNVAQLPYAMVVLLKSDFLIIDLVTSGASYPCFESPYGMDIHESPVSYLHYVSDCPMDLIAALTLVGRNQRRQQGVRLSNKPWPITGGVGRECASGHQEIVLTGHEDGSVKFWQASGEHLQIMYKLKTARHFEKANSTDGRVVSFAVRDIQLCLDSRLLLIAGAHGQVTLFRFVKVESSQDIATVVLPQLCSSNARSSSPPPSSDAAEKPSARLELHRQRENVTSSYDSQHSTDTSIGSQIADSIPIKVRGGVVRRPAGYQPELVCQIPWVNGAVCERVTAMAMNSMYGVIAIGTSAGMGLVDMLTFTAIYSWSNSELYNRDNISFSVPTQPSDSSPSESLSSKRRQLKAAHSTVTPPSTSSGKSFIRLNTDFRQRSAERQRPVLSKAQSMAVTGHETESSCNGEFRSDTRSRSPSPANSTAEKGAVSEFVTSLVFISCCSKKGSAEVEPCLWLGMSTGVVIAFNLFLPVDRIVSNVVVAPSDMYDSPKGSVIRLQDRVIYVTFMDRSLSLIAAAAENYRDPAKESQSAPTSANADKVLVNRTLTKPSQAPTIVSGNENGPASEELSQIGVFVSEQEIRVISLPGYHQLFHKRVEIPFIKARTTHIRGHPALLCLNAAGHLVVFSLPSLKPLIQSPLFRCSVDIDDPICARTDFSEHGLGMYAVTPSELQKFTVCSEMSAQVKECAGDLFVPCDMPEAPKTSFLRGVSTLFGGSQKEAAELESVFAEKPNSSTGSSMKSVARQLPNNSVTNMEAAQRQNVLAGQAAAMAIQNLNERSEKLNATVDATEQLRGSAMSLQQRSSKLVEKYEKKRWFQL